MTGACLMVSKEIYDRLNGLDETFAVALNDVDFCLRARELGYLNVFPPFAELYHPEGWMRHRGKQSGISRNATVSGLGTGN